MENDSSDAISLIQSGGASIVSSKPLFSIDAKYLICPCGSILKVFSVTTGELFQSLIGHLKEVTGVCHHPKVKLQILSSSLDKTVKVWDYEDGIVLKSFTFSHPISGICSNHHFPNVVFVLKKYSGKKNSLHRFKLSAVEANLSSEETNTIEIASNISSSSFVGLSKNFLLAARRAQLRVFTNPSQTKKNCQIRHKLHKSYSRITCVACHPTENNFLTGHTNGMIRIWHNITDVDNIVNQIKHWHSLEVLSLCFTPGGSMFLSGGHEKVLVLWTSTEPQFLPRLGSDILSIATSTDGTLFATTHKENSILIISNLFMVKQTLEGFTGAESAFDCGMHYDAVTGACVANGKPGHLLFYVCPNDTQLYNLDIIGRNFISAEHISKPLSATAITKLAFTTTNHDEKKEYFMATVEFNSKNKCDQKMKFWRFDQSTQNWTLETVVASPHSNCDVTSVRFHPHEALCITTACDCLAKVWIRLDHGWTCDATTSYKGYKPQDAYFSQDGSLLALAFQHALLLCEPLQIDNLTLFSSFSSNIKFIMFGRDKCCHLVIVVTEDKVECWSVISCAIMWTSNVSTKLVVQDQFSEKIALFTRSNQIFVFEPSNSDHLFTYDLDIEVEAACFVPNPNEDTPWGGKSTLYMISNNATVWKFGVKSRHHPDRVQRERLTGSLKNPISSLLAVKIGKLSQNNNVVPTSLRHSTIDAAVKNILETPVHVLPPMSTLCGNFISSLVFDNADNSTKEDENEEDKMEDEDMSHDCSDKNEIAPDRRTSPNKPVSRKDFAFLTETFKAL